MRSLGVALPAGRVWAIAAALFTVTAWGGGDSFAICYTPRIISSAFPEGALSYIRTPGVLPSASASTITDDFRGFFWSLGDGQPSFAAGRDNGAFVALGESGWVKNPPGYPAVIHTAWSAARQIDGCIDRSDGTRCMAVLLTDQLAGQGFFALVTASPEIGNYSLAQPGNAPILLAPLSQPTVSNVVTTAGGDVTVSLTVNPPSQGLYLDPDCSSSVFIGYRLYVQTLPRGTPAPTELGRLEPGGWTLASGGESVTGQPLPLGSNADVTRHCNATEDIFVAAALVFDSGFETPHLSQPTGPIPCGGQ